jgi:hypothetical protein
VHNIKGSHCTLLAKMQSVHAFKTDLRLTKVSNGRVSFEMHVTVTRFCYSTAAVTGPQVELFRHFTNKQS